MGSTYKRAGPSLTPASMDMITTTTLLILLVFVRSGDMGDSFNDHNKIDVKAPIKWINASQSSANPPISNITSLWNYAALLTTDTAHSEQGKTPVKLHNVDYRKHFLLINCMKTENKTCATIVEGKLYQDCNHDKRCIRNVHIKMKEHEDKKWPKVPRTTVYLTNITSPDGRYTSSQDRKNKQRLWKCSASPILAIGLFSNLLTILILLRKKFRKTVLAFNTILLALVDLLVLNGCFLPMLLTELN